MIKTNQMSDTDRQTTSKLESFTTWLEQDILTQNLNVFCFFFVICFYCEAFMMDVFIAI